jgi:hypothetical protein
MEVPLVNVALPLGLARHHGVDTVTALVRHDTVAALREAVSAIVGFQTKAFQAPPRLFSIYPQETSLSVSPVDGGVHMVILEAPVCADHERTIYALFHEILSGLNLQSEWCLPIGVVTSKSHSYHKHKGVLLGGPDEVQGRILGMGVPVLRVETCAAQSFSALFRQITTGIPMENIANWHLPQNIGAENLTGVSGSYEVRAAF